MELHKHLHNNPQNETHAPQVAPMSEAAIDHLVRRIVDSLVERLVKTRSDVGQIRDIVQDMPRLPDERLPLEVANEMLEKDLSERRAALEEATRIPAHAIELGVSNKPQDPRMWGADWREHLPDGHPAKYDAIQDGSFVVMGSEQYVDSLRGAHEALRPLDLVLKAK